MAGRSLLIGRGPKLLIHQSKRRRNIRRGPATSAFVGVLKLEVE